MIHVQGRGGQFAAGPQSHSPKAVQGTKTSPAPLYTPHETHVPGCMQPTTSTERQADGSAADSSSSIPSLAATSGLSSWPELKHLNAAVTVTPFESDTHLRNRKRPRPSAPSSPTTALFPTPEDLKLDFAGFEVGLNAASAVTSSLPLSLASSSPTTPCPPTSSCYSLSGDSPASSFDNVLAFLTTLQLGQDSAALLVATQHLAQDGFDSMLALAFASETELQHAGITDTQFVWHHVHRHFQSRQCHFPAVLSPSFTVSRWLELCGIPQPYTFEYAEQLCRLGYASVRDFEFIVHDQRALAVFKIGHSRLVAHAVQAASSQEPQQQQQQPIASYHHCPQTGSNVYTVGSTSALLQPVDIQRANEIDVQVYDSFLEALIEPTEAEKGQQQHYPVQRAHDANALNLSDPADVFGHHLNFGSAPSSPVSSTLSLRLLPQEHLQLLYEAVNLPRPNPCRRGKKIYWSVLATGGTKLDQFTPLAQFTAAELQNAYLRQFEVPATNPVKIDAWSEENIRQLEHAVKDPRCRHLSKVCWEMLATGRTGVDEYAPLAKFTASQLRSRFRSLFGDKRPQKLRQRKQMQRLQQQKEQHGTTRFRC